MPSQDFQIHDNDRTDGFGKGRGQRCGSAHQGRRGHGQRCGSGHKGGQGRGHHGTARRHDAASLRLATLAILADQPGNGLTVMQALTTLGFCPTATEASSVYPTLSLLTDMGMISASTEAEGQTVYTVLDEGAAMLAFNRPLIEAIMAETVPGQGRSGEGLQGGLRRRHCCGHQEARESAPAA